MLPLSSHYINSGHFMCLFQSESFGAFSSSLSSVLAPQSPTRNTAFTQAHLALSMKQAFSHLTLSIKLAFLILLSIYCNSQMFQLYS